MTHKTGIRLLLAVLACASLAPAAVVAAAPATAPRAAAAPDPSSRVADAGALALQTPPAKAEIVYKPLPKSGKKYDVDADTYLIWSFAETPKMGTAILKIQVFNRKDEQIAPFKITGRSDMPSMRGAHDSGDVEFKLNRRNDYLMPVNVVMPGDWEVRVTVSKDGRPVFYGSIAFDV